MNLEKEFDNITDSYRSKVSNEWTKTLRSIHTNAIELSDEQNKIIEDISDDVDEGIGNIVEIIKYECVENIIPEYTSYLSDLNTMSDEELVVQINKDKDVYGLLFNPSEYIIEYYKLKYGL